MINSVTLDEWKRDRGDRHGYTFVFLHRHSNELKGQNGQKGSNVENENWKPKIQVITNILSKNSSNYQYPKWRDTAVQLSSSVNTPMYAVMYNEHYFLQSPSK